MTRTRDTIVALAGAAGGFVLGVLAGNAIGRLAADVDSEEQTFDTDDGQRIHIHTPGDDAGYQREMGRVLRRALGDDHRRSNRGRN